MIEELEVYSAEKDTFANLPKMRIRYIILGKLKGKAYAHSGTYMTSDKVAKRAVGRRLLECLSQGLSVKQELNHIFETEEPEEDVHHA